MARKRFMLQILPAFMAITFLSLILLAFVATRTIETIETEKAAQDLAARAILFRAAR